MADWQVLLTCEHAGNLVPPRYRRLFQGNEDVLQTHRGYDIGALKVAKGLAKKLDAPLFYSNTSRLLVDLNRSLKSHTLFSPFSRPEIQEEKLKILHTYYFPYRQKIIEAIQKYHAKQKNIAHISIHSFTPVLDGTIRKADVGLLFDPRRAEEKCFCRAVAEEMRSKTPLAIRFNYPYRGRDDGLTSALRALFGETRYLGIEIEMNQAICGQTHSAKVAMLTEALGESVCTALLEHDVGGLGDTARLT